MRSLQRPSRHGCRPQVSCADRLRSGLNPEGSQRQAGRLSASDATGILMPPASDSAVPFLGLKIGELARTVNLFACEDSPVTQRDLIPRRIDSRSDRKLPKLVDQFAGRELHSPAISRIDMIQNESFSVRGQLAQPWPLFSALHAFGCYFSKYRHHITVSPCKSIQSMSF